MTFAWIALCVFVAAAVAFDMRPSAHASPSTRSALTWSIIWTVAGVVFAVAVLGAEGAKGAGDYLSVFLIEKSLSLDNLFVFAVLFSFFSIPDSERQRVLVLGIAGAILLRTAFILAGIAVLNQLDWFTYVLGALLAFTAYKVARQGDDEVDPDQTRIMKLLRRLLPLSENFDGAKLLISENGKRVATPLMAAFLMVAAFDVIFAIDSIPAAFAITRDTYIVFAANAFSLLGMVSLYFLLDDLLARFRYLSQGLAVILGYVALKLLLEDVVHPPVWVNLVVVVVTLAGAAWLSKRREDADASAARAAPEPQTG